MSSKFNEVIFGEETLDGFQIIDLNWNKEGICKRCGEPFTKEDREQIFCSHKCLSSYRTKINNLKGITNKQGQTFKEWMNDSIDYSYSPEKF